MSVSVLVSIVVIGRNEGVRLERCLHSVAAMTRDGFTTETIYVDSGSDDSSVVLAETMGAIVVQLEASRPTAAMGRNAGWRIAHGSVVLFLDGDTELHPRFVADTLTQFDTPGTAVVWGHRREIDPRRSLFVRVMDLDWVYPVGDTDFCGGDALVGRSVLEATNGFDETLIAGEEPELCRRIRGLGWRIVHVDRPMTGHDLAIQTFSQYWRRATRTGYAYAEVSTRYAGTGDEFWSADAKRNRMRAWLLMGLSVAGIGAAMISKTLWPMVFMVSLLLVLVARTAWKARWKSNDITTLLLYGVHSHLQQLPIWFGQQQFWWDRLRGKRAGLVEYKRS